jgi:hypothetical protein
MIHATFEDGPAQGIEMNLGRTPTWLRLVCDPRRQERGGWDALDQLGDAPEPDEVVTVYERTSYGCRGGPGEFATYKHAPHVDGGTVREQAAWRATVEELCGEKIDPEGSPVG